VNWSCKVCCCIPCHSACPNVNTPENQANAKAMRERIDAQMREAGRGPMVTFEVHRNTLKQVEREFIRATVEWEGDMVSAARVLGTSRSVLYAKLKRHDLLVHEGMQTLRSGKIRARWRIKTHAEANPPEPAPQPKTEVPGDPVPS
jgi:DNA-binding protein Fis